MNKIFYILVLFVILLSCKNKRKDGDDGNFIPVQSFLKGQVAKMDSSLATIIRIDKGNDRADTTYISRQEFKQHAMDFLSLPDISSAKLRDSYTAANMHDDLLNAFVFTYTTADEDLPLKKQDVIVTPLESGDNQIQSINFDYWERKNDSTIHKNMLWETDKRFLIITKVQKSSQPETIRTMEVKWSDTPRGY